MIKIKKSITNNKISCNDITKEQLLESTIQHINDVKTTLKFFQDLINVSKEIHDWDKIEFVDEFFNDFKSGFKNHQWFDCHVKTCRHHLNNNIPNCVNLIDILEMICDCVVAGLSRTGTTYPIELSNELLQTAVDNTYKLLLQNIDIEE